MQDLGILKPGQIDPIVHVGKSLTVKSDNTGRISEKKRQRDQAIAHFERNTRLPTRAGCVEVKIVDE